MQRQEREIAKLSAQEMYLHIINKCKTQTRIIAKTAVRTFIPMLDDKLELENKGEKKVE